jgi:transposase
LKAVRAVDERLAGYSFRAKQQVVRRLDKAFWLAKPVLNAAWGQLISFTSYKAESAGGVASTVPRGTYRSPHLGDDHMVRSILQRQQLGDDAVLGVHV